MSINLVKFLPKKNHNFSLLRPTERERTERLIKTKLREIMMQKDLENITSKEVRDFESSLFQDLKWDNNKCEATVEMVSK